MEPEESETKESIVRRACDQCRLRKIRCDKRSPCSNCRSSQIACRSTGAGQKPPETKRRVLISSEYEKKIDLIEERLGGIEEILHDLKSHSFKSTSGQFLQPTPGSKQMTSTFPSLPAEALDQHESVNAFEGNSSLTAQSAYASKFLESAVSCSPLQMSTPKMEAALSSLKQIVNFQDNKNQSGRGKSFLQSRKNVSILRNLTLPPVEAVLPILREIKENPLPCMQALPFIGTDRLIEKCQQVFFATEDYSDATFIIVNGGLYFVFSEFMLRARNYESREAFQKHISLCRVNMETALANLNPLMPANNESIEALLLGTVHSIEISKPSLGLALMSLASHICMTLGYHQISSMEGDNETVRNEKMNLFWSVYCLEKALTLRVGRASSIPDYDISIPASSPVFGNVEPWNSMYTAWVIIAGIQGKVYELLYSHKALNQPEEQRARYVHQLGAELERTVIDPYEKTMNQLELAGYDQFYVKADQVSQLSLKTLIYRAMPPQADTPGTFPIECITAARDAIEAHQQCMKLLKEHNEGLVLSYFHWTILYSPFVPFIVLFCHTINVSSEADLHSLEDFVNSLRPVSDLSEAIAKLYRLCQVLFNIAKLYLEAKAQAQTQEEQAIGQEFDTYLSALGLAPVSAEYADGPPTSTGAAAPGPISAEMMQGIQGQMPTMPPSALRNWYSGNQHMMGLLEEDLSLFDPSVWW
ncbi:hypothetical protein FE257_012928 [Aspergillus nanangensis]|uniref:Zn(2)-C6 fungal-type domain-containing protein n=1 Tax=Aspergillus nanangensis TaxID=2582783 RepID=A0AAD4CF80_ASPNN|nr:hypothetical protein FE257_012928 [Aspergillus nanangensis]